VTIHEGIDTGYLVVVGECGPSQPLWSKEPGCATEDSSASGRGIRLHQEGVASVVYDHSNDVSEETLWAGWQAGELEILKDEVEIKVRHAKKWWA
jgi:hypothetical protein